MREKELDYRPGHGGPLTRFIATFMEDPVERDRKNNDLLLRNKELAEHLARRGDEYMYIGGRQSINTRLNQSSLQYRVNKLASNNLQHHGPQDMISMFERQVRINQLRKDAKKAEPKAEEEPTSS